MASADPVDRDLLASEMHQRADQPVAGQHDTVLVDHDRPGLPEHGDGAGEFLDLLFGVDADVTRRWTQRHDLDGFRLHVSPRYSVMVASSI
jgi:hypothetical protein